MKKTIIALAAASSVALSHGVAVAEETQVDNAATAQAHQNTGSTSSQGEDTTNNESGAGEGATKPEDDEQQDTTSSSAQDLFGWKDGANPFEKIAAIAAAFTAVVTLLGAISGLFASIEKIVKQFTK